MGATGKISLDTTVNVSCSLTVNLKGFFERRRTQGKSHGPFFTGESTKKGTMTELDAGKRNKRAVKVNRGIGGQSWAEIQAKKNQKPEIRKAQREAAIAAQKAKKKDAADKKKTASKAKGTGFKLQVTKNVKQQKQRVGGKR